MLAAPFDPRAGRVGERLSQVVCCIRFCLPTLLRQGRVSFYAAQQMQVAALFPDPDTAIVVGCKSGRRSAAACQVLAAQGYSQLQTMEGGFQGAHLMMLGWAMQGGGVLGGELAGLPAAHLTPFLPLHRRRLDRSRAAGGGMRRSAVL